jgi:Pterin 4 alpha carbinolamine dehydratase
MTNLAEKTCTPCRGGVPPLTAQQAEELRGQSPEWALVNDAHRIERTFRLRDFREALAFVQKVGEIAGGCVRCYARNGRAKWTGASLTSGGLNTTTPKNSDIAFGRCPTTNCMKPGNML